MKARHWFALQLSLLLLAGALFLVPAQSGHNPDPKASMRGNLEGTWRLVSYKYGQAQQFTNLPKDQQTRLKFITATHFIWVDLDPKTKQMLTAAGGRCSLADAVYKETIEFGLGKVAKDLRVKEQTFTVKVEGDTYHQSGTLVFGGAHPETMKLEEVWERVK